jgi:membrane fusion protein, multidrug efflux system
VRIDPEEFESRVAAAGGELADARAQVATAQAALVSLAAEERLAASNVAAADTSIRSSLAESQRAAADHQRYEDLASSGAVAKSDVDRFGAAAVTAAQESAKARALLAVARDSERVTQARRPALDAALLAAQARVVKAQAALDLAKQEQKHATIYAPIDGVVGNRQVQTGDYVQAGTRLLTLVPLHALYVTANFKETQTGRMRPGQTVRIEADALSGTELTGTVESIAPGSGSTFSLLPFEPGTGNFTKIVQRVPVRIRFAQDQPALDQLRPGLSVTAKVRVKAS